MKEWIKEPDKRDGPIVLLVLGITAPEGNTNDRKEFENG